MADEIWTHTMEHSFNLADSAVYGDAVTKVGYLHNIGESRKTLLSRLIRKTNSRTI